MPRSAVQIDAFVGSRIAARRRALSLSQTALGLRLGVSFQQVQKYESGANRVSASRLHQIAVHLGAPVADFFPPTPEAGAPPADAWACGAEAALMASAEGRAMAAAFPRIADRDTRRALSRIADALADAARP